MKKLFILLAALAAGVTQAQTKETRHVSGFEGIHSGSGIEVVVTMGDNESLTFEAEESVMKYLVAEVKSGVLHIYSTEKTSQTRKIKAIVGARSLKEVEASGASQVTVTNLLKAGKFELEVSGAASFKAEINADVVDADVEGAGTVKLTGKSNDLELELSGASQFKAPDFDVNSVNIKAEGASGASLTARKSLKVTASGASTIKYSGEPTEKVIDVKGASSVKKA